MCTSLGGQIQVTDEERRMDWLEFNYCALKWDVIECMFLIVEIKQLLGVYPYD